MKTEMSSYRYSYQWKKIIMALPEKERTRMNTKSIF